MAVFLLALMAGVPFVYYRDSYTYGKRLRPVVKGALYRSGCMTAPGFTDAIRTHHLHTIINLMEDNVDPNLPAGYFDPNTVHESQLCQQFGAKMINLTVDLIEPQRLANGEHPAAIKTFRELMDNPDTYPALIHCRAGLHRTGVMVAIYRMEYQGWTRDEAMCELRAHGFGHYAATAANDYIAQYVLLYQPRSLAERPSHRPWIVEPLHFNREHGGIDGH
jgi:protein tyrosine/serine phosphatase